MSTIDVTLESNGEVGIHHPNGATWALTQPELNALHAALGEHVTEAPLHSKALAQRAFEQATALELRTQARNRDSRLSALERRVGVLTSTMELHMNKETP